MISSRFLGFVLASTALLPLSSEAYIVAKRGVDPINYNEPTTIIIAGRGKELQRQFQEAALAQANRYAEVLPGRQVVLIFAREYKNESDLRYVESAGYRVSFSSNETFTAKALFSNLERFRAIASMHVFSHHGAHVGAGLEGGSYRFHWNTPGAVDLKDNFAPKAFVVFHGCNSGFYTAPKLAASWGVPVAGSFTSTDFQQLHRNGQYYFNNPGQSPSGGWASYSTGKRMKPDNQPYKGMWGSFDGGGLGFFKFFCPWGEDGRCLQGMSGYLLTYISTINLSRGADSATVQTVAKDIMCPNDASSSQRNACFAALDRALATGDETYSPFRGRALQCNMASCSFEFKCDYDRTGRPVEGTCSLRNTAGTTTTTFVQEYKRLLRAANYLSGVQSSGGGFLGMFRGLSF